MPDGSLLTPVGNPKNRRELLWPTGVFSFAVVQSICQRGHCKKNGARPIDN
jgi:hypothetical protein